MRWSYGITTVPKRINDLLPRTIDSLKKGGFNEPHLFVDGGREEDYKRFNLPTTVRSKNVRTAGNWVLSLIELYALNPTAERFALFQDDFVTYNNVRQYLEGMRYPDKGYLNLYTFPENQSLNTTGQCGWFKSNQCGRGAVALVFSLEAVTALLGQPYLWTRFQSAKRGHCAIDGGIVDAMKNVGYSEYVHTPSLVQHTGIESSMGNSRHASAPVWYGEGFDAATLLETILQEKKRPRVEMESPPVEITVERATPAVPIVRPTRSAQRIGLVGYHCRSGLGELNRQLAKYADIDTWLIKPHGRLATLPLPDDISCRICPTGKKVSEFLNDVDVVLFCETPYYPNLIEECKARGKKIVCVPMIEWLPTDGWVNDVDLFLCPTKHSQEVIGSALPTRYFPWPIDLERYPFHQRKTCERFVFINGNGGWHGRKGAEVILRAKQQWPEMPLLVYDQTVRDWPSGIEVRREVAENSELYQTGDVLLSPHFVDGLALEPLEAAASGMPIIMTAGKPWNEYPALDYVASSISLQKIGRTIDWYSPDATDLVRLCEKAIGKGIAEASVAAREWAESRDWIAYRDTFNSDVRSVLNPL